MDRLTPVRTEIPAAAYRTLASFRDSLLHYDRASLTHVRAAGLTAQQYALLLHIAAHERGTPSVGELAAELLLGHNSLVELSQRAERGGLLQRAVDPGQGNRTLLLLTGEGARRVDRVTRALVQQLGPERMEVRTSLSRWEVVLRSPSLQATFLQPDSPLPPHTIRRALARQRPLTWALLQQHLHVLSPYHRVPLTARGEYTYPGFARYWTGRDDHAWLVQVDGRPAGFALVHRLRGGASYALPELGIVPAWQGRGLARELVRALLADRPGRWTVGFHRENVGARRFWERILAELDVEVAREQSAALALGHGYRWSFTVTV